MTQIAKERKEREKRRNEWVLAFYFILFYFLSLAPKRSGNMALLMNHASTYARQGLILCSVVQGGVFNPSIITYHVLYHFQKFFFQLNCPFFKGKYGA